MVLNRGLAGTELGAWGYQRVAMQTRRPEAAPCALTPSPSTPTFSLAGSRPRSFRSQPLYPSRVSEPLSRPQSPVR
eukprot:582309-Rhodomonas_salina.2